MVSGSGFGARLRGLGSPLWRRDAVRAGRPASPSLTRMFGRGVLYRRFTVFSGGERIWRAPLNAVENKAMSGLRTPLLFVFLFWVCAGAAGGKGLVQETEAPPSVRPPHERLLGAFAQVFTDVGFGMGGVVDGCGNCVLTSAHVVAGVRRATLLFPDRTRWPAVVAALDFERDLAVLRVAPAALAGRPRLVRAARPPLLGEKVFTYGGTAELFPILVFGHVLYRSPQVYLIDAAIQRGYSGGPVCLESGELIGVTVFRQENLIGVSPVGDWSPPPSGDGDLVGTFPLRDWSRAATSLRVLDGVLRVANDAPLFSASLLCPPPLRPAPSPSAPAAVSVWGRSAPAGDGCGGLGARPSGLGLGRWSPLLAMGGFGRGDSGDLSPFRSLFWFRLMGRPASGPPV